jgi:hypothetical protein
MSGSTDDNGTHMARIFDIGQNLVKSLSNLRPTGIYNQVGVYLQGNIDLMVRRAADAKAETGRPFVSPSGHSQRHRRN